MHRDAEKRGGDMQALKGAGSAQHLRLAIHIDMAVRHLLPALRGVDEQRADPALDIHSAVRPSGAGGVVEGVELLFPSREIGRQRLQHPRPVMEGHGAEGGAADAPSVVRHRFHIRGRAAGLRHQRAGGGVVDRAGVGGGDPFACGVAGKKHLVSFQSENSERRSGAVTPVNVPLT